MTRTRTRLGLASGAAAALIATVVAVAAAQTPADPTDLAGGRGFGPGWGRPGRILDRVGGFLGARYDGFVSSELVRETDDGFVTDRVQKGVVDAASDTSLSLTLATGDSASVTVDDDTVAVEQTEDVDAYGPFGRGLRVNLMQVDVADIAPGSEVIVWSESQADGAFLAGRIYVLPADETTTDDSGATEDTESADAEASPAADA